MSEPTAAPRRRRQKSADIKLIVGGESRVDLLPAEINDRQAAKALQRMLVAGVAIVAVLTAGGWAATTLAVNASASALAAEQSATTTLIAQQSEFIEVEDVERELTIATAAKQISASTEVDWLDRFTEIKAALPPDTVIRTLNIEMGTPLQPYAQAGTPLQGPRVGTLTVEVESPAIPNTSAWMRSLEAGLTGFVDASPSAIVEDPETGVYKTTLSLHIGADAYSNRFVPADADATDEGSD